VTLFIALADSYREAISDAADFTATDPASANAPSPGVVQAVFRCKPVASASLARCVRPYCQVPDRFLS
jgi:hypothetical protein